MRCTMSYGRMGLILGNIESVSKLFCPTYVSYPWCRRNSSAGFWIYQNLPNLRYVLYNISRIAHMHAPACMLVQIRRGNHSEVVVAVG